MERPFFRPFIPGTRRKPGTAGLSTKEIRDRKRKRLELQHQQQLLKEEATQPPIVTPLSSSAERQAKNMEYVITDHNGEHQVSRPCVESSSSERQGQQENTDETVWQDRQKSPLEEQNTLQNLQHQIESYEKEEKDIREHRCRLQKQIQQMEGRRIDLSVVLDNERIELQQEEKKYQELETDLAGFQETWCQIKWKREEIAMVTQKKRTELMHLQAMAEDIRKETAESENIQNDCMKEIECRTRELEGERSAFAEAMKKATSKISRLRETIEKLKECNRKEADARAAAMAAAKQAVSTGKLKVSLLLSDNSTSLPSMSNSELKTVYWKPNAEKKERRRKKSMRPWGHGAVRRDKTGNFESESEDDKIVETSDSMEVHTTPLKHRTPRRPSHVDLKSQVDSLSRLGDTQSVNERKVSSAEKRKEYGTLRRQLSNNAAWRTDSLATSSHDKGGHNSSPKSLTYMGHEILRKHRRPSAQLSR